MILPVQLILYMRIFLLLPFLFAFGLTNAQTYTVATYNIRYQNDDDTGNLWKDRAPIVSELIRFHDFDIFGTQEGFDSQLQDIATALPQYNRSGIGRDDGKKAGEHSAIFYKTSKFKLLNHGDFWLSETPEKPSLGWDAKCCNRICSWVYLQDKKTGKKFYYFNAHFDHEGAKARIESSKLVLQKIRSIAGTAPVIFTGDLNGDQKSTPYLELANSGLLSDTYKMVEHPYLNNGSFNSFKGTNGRMGVIDHIFVTSAFKASKWGVLTDTYHSKFPSDHFPVMAVVTIK
jgi:endonuclease/exonuclease/phosphatase family metal-dependent hydrolase